MQTDPEHILREATVEDENEHQDSEIKTNFLRAWCLPNVLIYASAFFVTKFVVYAVFQNLPTFLSE